MSHHHLQILLRLAEGLELALQILLTTLQEILLLRQRGNLGRHHLYLLILELLILSALLLINLQQL